MPILHRVALAVVAFASVGVAEKPTVVVVLIDDMGYGDLSCSGNPDLRTENFDRLAAQGIRFEQFYGASPTCSPSRVAITTGRYPARHMIHSYLDSRKCNRERPFYLHVWLNDVHDSFVPKPDLLREYRRCGSNPYRQQSCAV